MKQTVQRVVIAVVLLAVIVVAVLVLRQPTDAAPAATGSAQGSRVQPGAVQPPAQAPVPASVQEDGEVQAFVTEPVSDASPESPVAAQPAGHDGHPHSDPMEKPSPAIIKAIGDIRNAAPGAGQAIENPDGSVKMELGQRFHSVPVATIGKDGKVHVDHHGEKYLEEQNTPASGEQASGLQEPEAAQP